MRTAISPKLQRQIEKILPTLEQELCRFTEKKGAVEGKILSLRMRIRQLQSRISNTPTSPTSPSPSQRPAEDANGEIQGSSGEPPAARAGSKYAEPS